ncbi:MAG TPA: hypothetical protein VFZ58_03365 [Candidatus Saccharimonadales bacterium]
MSKMDNLPSSFIDPAIERVGRVEHALSHVIKAVQLELADLALEASFTDQEKEERLKVLGGALLRLSTNSLTAANGIADMLGKEQFVIANKNGQQQISIEPRPLYNAEQPVASVETVGDIPSSEKRHTPQVSGSELDHARPSSDPHLADIGKVDSELSSEKQQGELYQAIIPESKTPIMELREGMNAPIHITITSDNTIEIAGTQLQLEGDKLFIFNAFMMLRNTKIAASDVRELGFKPDSTRSAIAQAFSRHASNLREELKQAAGIEIVKRLGDKRNTRYVVNPAVVLHDNRVTSSEQATIVKKN